VFAQKKQAAPVITANKKAIIENVTTQAPNLISISDKIWGRRRNRFQ
jgi:hypothetical protein